MSAIDSYMADLADQLHTGRRTKARILEEVTEHLIDASLHAQSTGATPTDADTIAIGAFGPAKELARDANAQAGARATRRTPVLVLAAGCSVGIALVFAARNQPVTTENPWISIQISFFIGMLALQLAVVAGVCAASRAFALWHTAANHGSERAVVRRCSVISATALTVAAVSFTATFALINVRSTEHLNTTSLAIASCTMIVVSLGLLITTHRTRVNPSEDASVAHWAPARIFCAGEYTLDLVRDHPVAACTVVALVAGWTAMSHAETSIAGSLPWGITEIIAVVGSFATLRPALGLSARDTPTA
jgi:hypothetical protein